MKNKIKKIWNIVSKILNTILWILVYIMFIYGIIIYFLDKDITYLVLYLVIFNNLKLNDIILIGLNQKGE